MLENINNNIIKTDKKMLDSKKLQLPGTGEDFSFMLDQEISKTNEQLTNNDKKMDEEIDETKKLIPPFLPNIFSELFNNPLELNSSLNNEASEIHNIGLANPNNNELTVTPEANNNANPAWTPIIQKAAEQIFSRIDISKLLAELKKGVGLDSYKLDNTQNVPRVSFEQLYEELVKELSAKRSGPIQRLKLALEPKDLGKIDVYMFLDKNNKLMISFASSEETKKLLMNSQDKLADLLAQHGYQLTNMDFSNYPKDQQKDQEFLINEPKKDYDLLNILSKKDIIPEVNNLLSDIIVNYIA